MYVYPVQNEPQMLNFHTVSVFLNVQMSVTFKGNREKFSCKHLKKKKMEATVFHKRPSNEVYSQTPVSSPVTEINIDKPILYFFLTKHTQM